MSDDMKRYMATAHAMQSGVAMAMQYDPKSTEPKHLRVGINSAMSDQGGLAALLIEKGVFTLAEYEKAMADAMEREAEKYRREVSTNLGVDITLA